MKSCFLYHVLTGNNSREEVTQRVLPENKVLKLEIIKLNTGKVKCKKKKVKVDVNSGNSATSCKTGRVFHYPRKIDYFIVFMMIEFCN